jgi:hypothetical protein
VTTSDWIALGAAVVALGALWVSVAAFRQKARYHPQPKLIVSWSHRLEPSSGLFLRSATVTNHGDAPARDLTIEVPTARTEGGQAWVSAQVLEPSQSWSTKVPVVDRVVKSPSVRGVSYERTGDPGDYAFITPTVVLRWRQPPFSGRRKHLRSRAPHTPNMLAGETS